MSKEGNAMRQDGRKDGERPWSGRAMSHAAGIFSLKEEKAKRLENDLEGVNSEIEKLKADLTSGDVQTETMTPEDPRRKIATLIAGETNRRLGELRFKKEELEISLEEVKNPKPVEHTPDVRFGE